MRSSTCCWRASRSDRPGARDSSRVAGIVWLPLPPPLNRCAAVSEATGFEAKTIHRLLEVDRRNGGSRRDAHNPLHCSLLVIDETSMVDVMLMRALLAAVPDEAALLIVGDVDQLPSLGPGQVLADIIASSPPARCRWCG